MQIKDIEKGQMIFQLVDVCVKSLTSTDFLYLDVSGYLFLKKISSLYDVKNNSKVNSFYQFAEAYTKNFTFYNFQDKKLLFVDSNGKFFGFDLTTNQQESYINDSKQKINQLLFTNTFIDDTLGKLLVSLNESIYLVINNQFIQEFKFSNQQIGNANQIELNLTSTVYQCVIYQEQILVIINKEIQFYSQQLALIKKITIPFDYNSNVVSYVIDNFLFLTNSTFFYRFDLISTQVSRLAIKNENNQQIKLYKSQQILISQNYMINYRFFILLKAIKIQKDGKYLSNIDNLVFCASQDGQVLAFKNIQNNPASYVDFSKNNLVLISSQFDENVQLSYFYDQSKGQIIKINVFNSKTLRIFDFKETFALLYVDPILDIFIYSQADGSLKIFNPQLNDNQIYLVQKFSGISRIEMCFNSNFVAVQTTANQLFVLKYKASNNTGVFLDISDLVPQIKTKYPLIFSIQCQKNIIFTSSPLLKIFNLNDGSINSFQLNGYISYKNNLGSNPIIDVQNQLIIYPHSIFSQYYRKNTQIAEQQLYSFVASFTEMYYDSKNNYLIVLVGSLSQFTVVDYNLALQKYQYKTLSTFQRNLTSFIPEQNLIIVIDSTPQIYLYNYLTNTTNITPVYLSQMIQIITDINNNFIYIITRQSVHAFTFPQMIYYESFNDYLNPNNSNFALAQLIPEINCLFVVRQDSVILIYDLIESVIQQEKSLINEIPVQFIQFNNFIVTYNIYTSSLLLFKNRFFQDELLVDLLYLTVQKCDMFKINEQSLVFISPLKIYQINIDFEQNIFEILDEYLIKQVYSDILFDFDNSRLILIDQLSKQINIYDLNSKSITFVEYLLYNFGQVLIQKNQIIYAYVNKIISQTFSNNTKDNNNNNQLQMGKTKINFMIKLSSNLNKQLDEGFEDINQSNYYDEIENSLLLVVQNGDKAIYIIDASFSKINNQIELDYEVVNLVIDRKRKIIFCISNIQYTFIYDFSLKLLSQIKNPCLLSVKIFFDDQYIYSACPNSVYFYNSLTLVKQNISIISGFTSIENIKSFKSQNTFVIVEQKYIYIVQFQQDINNSLKILFQKQNDKLHIEDASIVFDSNNQKYYQIKAISWKDITFYLIPFQPENKCTASFISQNSDTNSQNVQIIQQNANLSKQEVSQIKIQFNNNQEISQLQNLLNQNIQIQTYIYAKNNDVLLWGNGNIADDPNIGELIIHDAFLNITNQLKLNQNQNIKQVLFSSINLIGLQYQIIFENIPKVTLFNITIKSIGYQTQNASQSLFIFRNCSLVILDNIQINYVNLKNQTIFRLENTTKLIMKNVRVWNSQFTSLIQIIESQNVVINSFNLQNITNQFQTVIYLIKVELVLISNLNIYETKQNIIFSFIGCYEINLNQITVKKVEDILILQAQPYQQKQIYPIDNLNIEYIDVSDSKNVAFNFQVNQFTILNSQFNSIDQITSNLISSKLSNIQISQCAFQKINLSQGQSIIRLVNFNDLTIEQSKFVGQKGNLIYLLNQNEGFQIQFNSLYIMDNTSQQENILINFAQKLIINKSEFINQISQQSGGSMNIQNTIEALISDSKFHTNQSVLGNGGSLYLYQIQNMLIQNSEFIQNQAQNESGGAIFLDQDQLKQTNSQITNSQFKLNQAIQGQGGAIAIKNCDLNLQNSLILSNKAAIGGGIYYQQMIPQIIQNKLIELNNNTILNNTCFLYGQNIASTLRRLEINQQKSKTVFVQDEDKSIIISNFRSGDYLFIDNIQILDEENNYYKYDPTLKYSQNVFQIIQKTTMTIDMQLKSQNMNIFGGIIITYQEGKFSFNVSLSYIPDQISNFLVQSQQIPSLSNYKGDILIPQQQLQLNFKVYFRKCVTGEIPKKFFTSVVCDECPDGKYSLNLKDENCKICPASSAVECQGSKIQVRDGYWRENNQTDMIIYCANAPENCQPQNNLSKFGCMEGYVGPLCEQCDFFGDVWGQRYQNTFQSFKCSKCQDTLVLAGFYQTIFVILLTLYVYICNRKIINTIERDLQNYYIKMMGLIYLNNSVQKNNTTVYSKILIDHLQIISILSSFSFQFPTIVQVSSNVGGNPLVIQTNIFDCFYPNELNIPKWFAKVICSLSLPLVFFKQNTHTRYQKTTIIFFYFYFYPSMIYVLVKSVNCIQIGDKKYAQVDTLIQCRDFSEHLIYNIFFSFPAIFIVCFIIPAFFIHKVRQNINQKLSKIQKSSYQFIYEPYKIQFYYWEFIRLLYKTAVMVSSIFFQQNLSLKVNHFYSIHQKKIISKYKILDMYSKLDFNHVQLCLDEDQSFYQPSSQLLRNSIYSDLYLDSEFLFNLIITC